MKKFLLSAFALFFVLSAVYSVTNMANAGFFDFLRGGDNQTAKVGSTESKLTISKNKKDGGRVYDSSGSECKTGKSRCSKKYTKGETVTLTAEAASGYAIQKWRGCDADGGEAATTCSVNMDKKRESVKIYFKKVSNETSPSLDGGDSSSLSNTTSNSTSVPILTIERKSKNYYGMVEVSSQYTTDPGRDSANTVRSSDNCQLTSSDSDSCIYSLPTTVEYVYYTLKAIPSEDSSFKRWTGCDKVEDETCSVTAYNKSETVKVYFKNAMPKKKLTLYVYNENNNTLGTDVWPGNVVIEKNGIQKEKCLSKCSDSYSYGSVLTLTATPNSGYEFDKWSGCKSGSNENECEVTMKSNKKVKAYFKKTEEATDDVTYKIRVKTAESESDNSAEKGTGYVALVGNDGTTKYCISESVPGYSDGSYNSSMYQIGDCEFTYNSGVELTLTSTAYSSDTNVSISHPDDEFTAGECNSISSSCEITLDKDRTITFTYAISTEDEDDSSSSSSESSSSSSSGVTCVAWRQTGNNSSSGPREENNDQSCDTTIKSGWSGYCECSDGSTVGYNSPHTETFTCDDKCISQ